jgi:hypothetical protein
MKKHQKGAVFGSRAFFLLRDMGNSAIEPLVYECRTGRQLQARGKAFILNT